MLEEFEAERLAIKRLRSKHPRLIPDPFGIECRLGWLEILERFFDDLDVILPSEAEFRPTQVKEKFGHLRIYHFVDNVSNEITSQIHDLVDLASARSAHTCEYCGRPGSLHKRGGWYMTVCTRHAETASEGYKVSAVECDYEPFIVGRVGGGWSRYDVDLDAFVEAPAPARS